GSPSSTRSLASLMPFGPRSFILSRWTLFHLVFLLLRHASFLSLDCSTSERQNASSPTLSERSAVAAILVNNISKSYRIGGPTSQGMLREAIINVLQNPFRSQPMLQS